MTADDQVRAARKIADDAAADVLAGLAVGRVAKVLAAHDWRWAVRSPISGDGTLIACTGCDWTAERPEGGGGFDPMAVFTAHRLHVAAAIVAALDPPP